METSRSVLGSASRRPLVSCHVDTTTPDNCFPVPSPTEQPTLLDHALSSCHPYTVFISHAVEDRSTLAIPLRERLRAKGILAFVDEPGMSSDTDAAREMIHALETARIVVFILSPEFIARKWPMLQLMHFLKHREDVSREGYTGHRVPTIIPCCYRLTTAELRNEPKLNRIDKDGKLLLEKTRFFERMKNDEPEADLKKIKVALETLHNITGVENFVDLNNETTTPKSKKQESLLNEIFVKVCKSIPKRMSILGMSKTAPGGVRNLPQAESFRSSFPPKLARERAVLDFDCQDAQGLPTTVEGHLKRYLLNQNESAPGVVSLYGLGGVGKSVILEALMRDDDIRYSFTDGVYLIRLGKDATRNTFFQHICDILEQAGADKNHQSFRERNDFEGLLDFFVKWFEGKRCAFFIDDVWESSIKVRMLSRLCDVTSVGDGNRVLVTTRERDIASLRGDANIVILDPGDTRSEVARQILFLHAGVAENDITKADATALISEVLDTCAGLPGSLAVAGKTVRRLIRLGSSPTSALKRYLLQMKTSRLRTAGTYGNLYATLHTSLEFLDGGNTPETLGFRAKLSFSEMHRRLCVLQKQTPVPVTMLMHLWGTESKENAEKVAQAFAEVGLGETMESASGWKSLFCVHNSVHDFAESEAHKHGEIADAHNVLLDGYSFGQEESSCQSGDMAVRWCSRGLGDDGYIHKNLSRHLVRGRRENELCKLLLTPLWAERQVEVNGVLVLQEDFRRAISEMDESGETKEALRLIEHAVNLSAMHLLRNKTELWFQLHGRLKECVMDNRLIKEYVKCMESNAAKPGVLGVNAFLMRAGEQNRKVFSNKSDVVCMAVFPDEERVACGCADGNVVVVNIHQNEIERKWKTHGAVIKSVRSLVVAQKGTQIVTLSRWSSTLDAWKVENGSHTMVINGHHGTRTPVSCFAVTHDESCMASVSREGLFQMWDLRTGDVAVQAIDWGHRVEGLRLLKDGERAIIMYLEGPLTLWNIRKRTQLWSTRGDARLGQFGDSTSRVLCVAITPDERSLVTGSSDGYVTLRDMESGQHIWSSKTEYAEIVSIAVSTDGALIASGNWDGTIRIWDMESGALVCDPLEGHLETVTGVSFLRNNHSILSCSLDGTVRMWDIRQKQSETSTDRHEGAVAGTAFTPDGKYVVTGSWDRTLRVWDAISGQTVCDPMLGHTSNVSDVVVTQDGRFVVSVSWDKTVRVWDLVSRNLLHTFKGHTEYVFCVAMTPKGDRAVTGSRDRTVRVWDLSKMDGSHLVFEGHKGYVHRVFVSDDGLRVISVDLENEVLVWDMETKDVLERTVVDQACGMSRREVFSVIGEDTHYEDAGFSIPLWSDQITHGEETNAQVLATLESKIASWDISPANRMICLGLEDGLVALLKANI